jgi:hypothetical protein
LGVILGVIDIEGAIHMPPSQQASCSCLVDINRPFYACDANLRHDGECACPVAEGLV